MCSFINSKKSFLKYLFTIMVFGVVSSSSAQQVINTTLYNQNRLTYNPAYAGMSNDIPVTAHVRQQWIGFDDAPRSQFLSSHAFLPHEIGFGGMIFNNISGPTRQSGLNVAFSKHLQIDERHHISLGISGDLYQNVFDQGKLQTADPNDPALTGEIEQKFAPDASTGFFIYADKYFGGFSVVNIIESRSDVFTTNAQFENPLPRTMYLTGGYVFDIDENFKYQPTILGKKTAGLSAQLDLTNKIIYQDFLWGALAYRTNNDISILLGAKYGIMELAYAYDFTTSELKTYNSGNQEIMLRLNLGNWYAEREFMWW
ncbi:type IX secretion system membrane protein PorP/SprF [Marinilabiliaceae bacterium ANBcel2]|nr:type IX secretion system membrane protein PorP/SprF [Marinilabiliaceae bacterium ANBcel2]